MNFFIFIQVFIVFNSNIMVSSARCSYFYEDPNSEPNKKFVEMINHHGLRILKSSLDKTEKNWFFLPINVFSVLSTLYMGSNDSFVDEFETMMTLKNNYEIHRQFAHFWKKWKLKTYKLETLDFILVNNKIRLSESFLTNASRNYPKSLIKKNTISKGIKEINKEIEKLTKDDIKMAIPEMKFTNKILLLLVSAGYLPIKFDVGFPVSEKKDFYIIDKNIRIKHDSIFVSGKFDYRRDKETGCDVVQIPVNNNIIKIFIVVPVGKTTLTKFRNTLESDKLKSWLHNVGFEKKVINLRIPKAAPSGVFPMRSIVAEEIFSKEDRDLRLMVNGTDGLYAEQYFQVLHTVYDVSSESGNAKLDPNGISVEAVIPFVFFVVDTERKMIILMGKYSHPPKY